MAAHGVWRGCLGAWLVAAAVPSWAFEAKNAESAYSFTLTPVVIDSSDSSTSSLGVDYDFMGQKQFATRKGTSAGSPTISMEDVDKPEHAGQVDVRLRGMLASSKAKAPHKLVDLAVKTVYTYDTDFAYYKLGGLFSFETDQSLDQKQHLFGVSGAMSKVGIVRNGDAGSVLLNYGSVKPTSDTERKAALGAAGTDRYRRWNLELSYSVPVNREKIRALHLDYRHYQETAAPAAVTSAGLDRHRLGLVRVDLDQGFFLQYSRGSLPFDVRSVRAVKLGWSTNIAPPKP
jgi:hypothetical protein